MPRGQRDYSGIDPPGYPYVHVCVVWSATLWWKIGQMYRSGYLRQSKLVTMPRDRYNIVLVMKTSAKKMLIFPWQKDVHGKSQFTNQKVSFCQNRSLLLVGFVFAIGRPRLDCKIC